MLKKLRPRSVYDVLAAIACFAALAGGTAYASHELIDSSDVVNESLLSVDVKNGEIKGVDTASNSVNGGKVIDNSLKGADIDEPTLAGVNADKVDGLHAARIHQVTTSTTTSPIEVLNLGGLILRLECVNTDFFEPKLVAATTTDDAVIRSRKMPDGAPGDDVVTIEDDNFDTDATTPGDEKTIYDNSQGSGLINYMSAGGTDVTVQYMVDGIGTSSGGCSISGTAFQGGP
jgi:hypothetical protein